MLDNVLRIMIMRNRVTLPGVTIRPTKEVLTLAPLLVAPQKVRMPSRNPIPNLLEKLLFKYSVFRRDKFI